MSQDVQTTPGENKEQPTKDVTSEVVTTEGMTKTDVQEETKQGEMKLTLNSTCEFDQLSYNQEYKQLLFMSSIKAPFFRSESRAPLDLICIVDESGSMSGERIELVKTTVEFVIKNLESHDRFGCVGYADNARRVLDLTKMDQEGKKKALEAVRTISATTSTAMCAGLLMGLDMMRERGKEANSVSSLMLFTDGQANVGYSTAQDIIRATIDPEFAKKCDTEGSNSSSRNYAPQQRVSQTQQPPKQNFLKKMFSRKSVKTESKPQAQQPGASTVGEKSTDTKEEEKTPAQPQNILPCTINTFGFGEGHNESLLQAIAEHGRGMYAFIKNTEIISETFAECLGGLVSVVAQNITLRVETLKDVKINKCVSVGLNLKVIQPNQCYEVTFADIQSEENRDVLFELGVPSVEEPKLDWPLAKMVCTYNNSVLDGQQEQVSLIASVARVDSKDIGERNYALDLQNNRLIAAEAMAEADKLASDGKMEDARKRLDTAQEKIKSSRTNQDKYSSGLIQDIQKCASGLRTESDYQSGGGKMLKMNYQSHNVQRAVQSTAWSSQEQYATTSKVSMKAKFK